MKIVTWNLEWATPRSKRGRHLADQIQKLSPDVACYTEIIRDFNPLEGFSIEADPDYGYPHDGEKRKVILWSREPWSELDAVGDPELPSGRFVSGITQGIRFVGVCIPWRDAHVRNGRKNREPWQDHLSYCSGLKRILERYAGSHEPVCILGDFNQRIPRTRQPEEIAQALLNAIPSGYSLATQGLVDSEGNQLIDHIAVFPSAGAEVLQILPRFANDGTRLSDHVGIFARIPFGD